MYYTKKYDDQLLDIGSYDEYNGFYHYFPQMLPWIGKDYATNTYKRIILIGESHYLPKDVDIELLDPNIWYNENHEDYYDKNSDEEEYTNTRKIVNLGKWSSNAHSIYREPESILRNIVQKENTGIECDNFFQFVSYYNYFLRPASKGESIRATLSEQDERIAKDTFNELVCILKPDFVYFLSKLSFETYKRNSSNENHQFIVDYSPHPCCSWWNRKKYLYDGEILTGKEKFRNFLIYNKVFDK